MNLIGKIFVFAVFIMSLVLMTFATAIYLSHTNWKDTVERPPEQVSGGKPLGLKYQLQEAEQEREKLDREIKELAAKGSITRKLEEETLNALRAAEAAVQEAVARGRSARTGFHEAQAKIGEAFAGISDELGDVGLAVQRAEDKTAQMQARAGAIDELVASGALTDVTSMGKDDITIELERMASESDVNNQLEAMKRELESGGGKPQIGQ